MAMTQKPRHLWPFLWGGIALGLVAVLVLENQFGQSTAGQGPRAPARVAEAKLLPAFRLPPEQQAGAETLARPLFVPGRRPSPPAASAGEGAIKKGQFILQGTTIVGPLSIALLMEVSSRTIHRVERGAELKGMTVADISAEKVVLKAGGDSETLTLQVAKGKGTAAAAVQSGPFGSPPAAAVAPTAIVRPAGAAPASRAAGALSAPMSTRATPESSAMTPEEIIARRRAARRPQPQN
jgi:hypothetical protein